MPLWGLVATVVGAALLAGIVVLVARYVPVERREPLNEVVGFVYAVVGVIYAVVLAMVVVELWGTFDDAKFGTYTESNALIELHSYAQSLPQPACGQLSGMTRAYTETVINEEWPMLGRLQVSETAWHQEMGLRAAVEAQQPQTSADQSRYQAALQAASTLGSARRERVNETTHGIPSLLWVALIIGSVVTVGFAFMFGMRNLVAHIAVVFCLALLEGSLLLLIFELNYPFAGTVRVQPEAFQLALNQLTSSC
jgi:hypothetical protein